MGIRFLNCFTRTVRLPSSRRSGALCILIETGHGLVLVDTGPGQEDYVRPSAILRAFQVPTLLPMDPQQAAVHGCINRSCHGTPADGILTLAVLNYIVAKSRHVGPA